MPCEQGAKSAAARQLVRSRTTAEPDWRTMASLDDIASPNAAEAARMLSRPIIANSIVCASDKRTIIEMMPLSGRYRCVNGALASIRTASLTSSTDCKCRRKASKSAFGRACNKRLRARGFAGVGSCVGKREIDRLLATGILSRRRRNADQRMPGERPAAFRQRGSGPVAAGLSAKVPFQLRSSIWSNSAH
jgi:hypothetical protein